jgi:hypothetical protein
MDESVADRFVTFYDKEGKPGRISYGDLKIQMGAGRLLSLAECLMEEKDRVRELQRISAKLSKKIEALHPIYDEIEQDLIGFYTQANERIKNVNNLPFSKRIKLLNSYYTLNSTHDKILTELTNHMLQGSEGDLSAHCVSLIRRALDFSCRVMRHNPRKTKRPAVLHSIEAARGAAKNGLRTITIVATTLHDVLEEVLDNWTEQLITRELQDPIYGEFSGKRMKQVPVPLRHKIIQKYIDAYNDRASGIFFQIGLVLYDHIRHFPVPGRHYESLHSIMDMVSALSRRRDMSYYSYLKDLLYPKPNAALDTMRRERLREELAPEFPGHEDLLDSYIENVHTFYQTGLSECTAKEEMRRNSFREILSKILDRLNNTRDMDRGAGFTIPSRLYGTGFKNILFLQAIEDKFRRPSFNTEERRLIEVKFINKPKVAALYQILEDIEYLEKELLGKETIQFLEEEIERYKPTRAFRRLTPPGRGGYFDGLIYLFNDITLGRKSNLVELGKRRDQQAEVLVAFKSVLESYLVYPALIREDMKNNRHRKPEECPHRPYRIEGMGPSMEHHSTARKEQAVDLLDLKTFNRRVI